MFLSLECVEQVGRKITFGISTCTYRKTAKLHARHEDHDAVEQKQDVQAFIIVKAPPRYEIVPEVRIPTSALPVDDTRYMTFMYKNFALKSVH
ncbi:uncharacterized protein ARMOST_04923 [Armillaria ostoyae]|uniref:Uncharacterized protein n=1 Tax=Armillaria ostoyae TaxID=47428 RepID=A0A284QYQ2_ARMOS|nr:uncharacterized protein ARMOST_04923 [Armillaria ostoyae]